MTSASTHLNCDVAKHHWRKIPEPKFNTILKHCSLMQKDTKIETTDKFQEFFKADLTSQWHISKVQESTFLSKLNASK